MACCKTGNNPLPKPVLAPFIDACILQQVWRVNKVKGDPRLDDRPGVRWPAIYGWHFWHQLKSPSWAPKFTNKIFSITCVFTLLYSEGTGAEMDSIHIYFETRVLSVSHTMIDNVPNSFNCVILLLPYHERAIKGIISWSAVSWMMACCLTTSSHYPCWYWLEIISIHPSWISYAVSSDQTLINALEPKYYGQHFRQSIVKYFILKYIFRTLFETAY